VKDINVIGEKMTRNGHEMTTNCDALFVLNQLILHRMAVKKNKYFKNFEHDLKD
jgi:hypothetical protein